MKSRAQKFLEKHDPLRRKQAEETDTLFREAILERRRKIKPSSFSKVTVRIR